MGFLKKFHGYAVIDLETTGLDKDGTDAIVEVAVILLDFKGTVTGYYETMVRPNRKLAAVNIHKINESMLVGAPSFDDIAESLATLLDGRKLVAHNAEFEANFLRKEFQRKNIFIGEENFIDTLKIARRALKLKSYKLISLTEYFQIPFFNAHTALSDTLALTSVFNKLKREAVSHLREENKNAKPFQYKGAPNYDYSKWKPRNPDVFVQTYQPYKNFNLINYFQSFNEGKNIAIRLSLFGLAVLAGWGIFPNNWDAWSVVSLVLFSWLTSLEHRWSQRLGVRRNRSLKHQEGEVSVEDSGGSITYRNSELTLVDEEQIFDENGVLIGGSRPLNATQEPLKPSRRLISPIMDEYSNPDAKPLIVPSIGSTNFDVKRLLESRSLSGIEYTVVGKQLAAQNNFIYRKDSYTYTVNDVEAQYVKKCLQDSGLNPEETGSLWEVAKFEVSDLVKIVKNSIVGDVENVEDSFTYDSNSYLMMYDHCFVIIWSDGKASAVFYDDISRAVIYKNDKAAAKLDIFYKNDTSGFTIKNTPFIANVLIKVFKKFTVNIVVN
jgi:DNA polymerase III epsilon subunit family exonuclease